MRTPAWSSLLLVLATSAVAEVRLDPGGRGVQIRATPRGVWSSSRPTDPRVLNPDGDSTGDTAPTLTRGPEIALAWARPQLGKVLHSQADEEWSSIQELSAPAIVGSPVSTMTEAGIVLAWTTESGEAFVAHGLTGARLQVGQGTPVILAQLDASHVVLGYIARPAPGPIPALHLAVLTVGTDELELVATRGFALSALAGFVIDGVAATCLGERELVVWWSDQSRSASWTIVSPWGIDEAVPVRIPAGAPAVPRHVERAVCGDQ